MRSGTLILTAVLVLAACSTGDAAGDDTDRGGRTGTVLVFAAASLTDSFEEIGTAFEAANPGVEVELNVGPSSGLREQILEGAPADVFASADEANMDELVDAGRIDGTPSVFAENVVEIAVPAGNPGGVTDLGSLADDGLLVGLCAEGVPCGELARETLIAAGVEASVDTEEPDVRSLLTKLAAGELDAGVVYRTDVLAAGGSVDGIEVPAGVAAMTRYPIAVVDDAPNPDVATAFVAFVTGAEGRRRLASAGFGEP
jgi:molybdate transport system substrate-binding protein